MLGICSFAFLIFFLIYSCKEIREGDVLIQKVSKGVPLLVKTQKLSSLVNNFSEVLPLPPPPQVRPFGLSVPVWVE